ncbi:hypothetical protein [Nitrosomonas sp. Is37]|uniref:hypothetical protein n=1 Tax=Nitrosomonas sp. Is37 TaxID=3080535 RepID=UPI00294B0897|nr:hypothetical protein [Nitrosomonas sp. Is37]MDV6345838.1 hypothetical protein [Nitrosomonas sp. Is37]
MPLKLDYHFLRRILIEQVYTDQNDTARVFEEQKDCSILVLSNPQIGPDANRIRIISAVEARFGSRVADQCWHIPKWAGFIEVFFAPAIVPEKPTIEFKEIDSNLLNREGDKPLVIGMLWDWITQHVHSRLTAFKVDLAIPLQEIQALVPMMLATNGSDAAQRTLESARFSGLEVAEAGIILNLQLNLPEMIEQPVILPPEPALTSEEALRWEAAWQRWDAFFTFVIKQMAKDTEQADLRQALFEVLLDGRYDLTEALINWKEGTPDPVRGLFLKSWERLAPILQQMEITLPSTAAIRYLSVITAADALKALDQVSEKVGYEISADGLRRLARMLAPELEEDPLVYSLEVDPELRRLFGFGSPMPMTEQAPDIDSGS